MKIKIYISDEYIVSVMDYILKKQLQNERD